MLSPVWAQISPALIGIIAGAVLLALGLIVAGLVSARRAARLPAATRPELKPEPRLRAAPAEAVLEPKPTPRAPPTEAPPSSPPLSAEERERLRSEEDTRKKEAYRQKKELEAQERVRKQEEERERASRAEQEAKQRREEEERQLAAAKAEEQRKVQAQEGRTLADGLAKTRSGFMSRLNGLLGGSRTADLDGQLLAQLEEVLFSADIGVKTASQLLEIARGKLKRGELADPQAVKGAIRKEIERIIEVANAPAATQPGPGLQVWMIVGVNGAGKTTTIGKLAAQLGQQGRKVVLAAADTFRAAATEQLEIWAQRSGSELVRGPEGGDPGSVAFEAIQRARQIGASHVLIDTAGRLHTKASLMEELKKVKRVIQKAEPGAPHQVMLILDSTNGQNAIAQARQFHESLQLTSLVLTKLDGTAKGGVVIGISDELKLPLRYVGVGETVADLHPFEPHEFVEALFA